MLQKCTRSASYWWQLQRLVPISGSLARDGLIQRHLHTVCRSHRIKRPSRTRLPKTGTIRWSCHQQDARLVPAKKKKVRWYFWLWISRHFSGFVCIRSGTDVVRVSSCGSDDTIIFGIALPYHRIFVEPSINDWYSEITTTCLQRFDEECQRLDRKPWFAGFFHCKPRLIDGNFLPYDSGFWQSWTVCNSDRWGILIFRAVLFCVDLGSYQEYLTGNSTVKIFVDFTFANPSSLELSPNLSFGTFTHVIRVGLEILTKVRIFILGQRSWNSRMILSSLMLIWFHWRWLLCLFQLDPTEVSPLIFGKDINKPLPVFWKLLCFLERSADFFMYQVVAFITGFSPLVGDSWLETSRELNNEIVRSF